MIISGYAGIGKSYLAHNYPMVMDLESTPFEKDWDRYAKCAIHYHNQGYIVLISCHKEIRELICKLLPNENERLTIVPSIGDKDIYCGRYKFRGNTQEFINLQMANWEKWLNEENNRLPNETWITMEKGETLDETLRRIAKRFDLPF